MVLTTTRRLPRPDGALFSRNTMPVDKITLCDHQTPCLSTISSAVCRLSTIPSATPSPPPHREYCLPQPDDALCTRSTMPVYTKTQKGLVLTKHYVCRQNTALHLPHLPITTSVYHNQTVSNNYVCRQNTALHLPHLPSTCLPKPDGV